MENLATPLKTHGTNKEIDARHIPDNLLLKIFKKMTFKEGARLRQTCHFVNELVEVSGIRFSPGSDFQLHLKIVPVKASSNFWHSTVCAYPLYPGRDRIHKELPYTDNCLACLHFDTILLAATPYLSFDDIVRLKQDFISKLKNLRLKCRQLILREISYTQYSQICSVISFSEFANDSAQSLYKVLNVVPQNKCSDIETAVSKMPPNGSLSLERIRHLEHLRIIQRNPNWTKEFSDFLQHIHFVSSGFLRTLFIEVAPPIPYQPLEDVKFTLYYWPNCYFVWEGQVRLRKPDAEHAQITLMETSEKTVVIITYNISTQWSMHGKICHEINFLGKHDCEEIVVTIFSKLNERQPLDMSPIVQDMKDSSPEEFPSVLCHYLQLKKHYLPRQGTIFLLMR